MRMARVLLLAAALTAVGCAPGNESSREQSEESVIEAAGTVRYVDLEGGFYGIVADDSTRYDPSGLPEEFQEDGLRVRFRAEPQEDVMTTRMWGRVIHLLDIERL